MEEIVGVETNTNDQITSTKSQIISNNDKIVKRRVSHKATKAQRKNFFMNQRVNFVSSVPPCENMTYYETINNQ